jgi:methionine--tRNA ligase beta chain
LRIGKILAVDELNDTRKPMYLLKVDLGELGIKTIVAGIRGYYSKEELIDSYIVVVANLDPKKVGAYVSEGMLLAAQEGENVRLVRPDKPLAPGSKVG